MTLVSRVGNLLWGTPVYDMGNRAFETAVEVYLRTQPKYTLSCGETTAIFFPRTFVEWNNLKHRIWDEADVLTHLLSNVRADDVFYDIGANMGIYACLVGVRQPDATIVGFEPYPPNVESLRKNLAANGIDAIVIEQPLSDASSNEAFFVYDTLDAGAQHGSLDTDYPTGDPLVSFTVETVTGDELVASERIPAPTVLKVDVQGSGLAVLDGLESTLLADECRLVYVEAHDNRKQLEDRLASLGYETSLLTVDRAQKDPTIVGVRNEQPTSPN